MPIDLPKGHAKTVHIDTGTDGDGETHLKFDIVHIPKVADPPAGVTGIAENAKHVDETIAGFPPSAINNLDHFEPKPNDFEAV